MTAANAQADGCLHMDNRTTPTPVEVVLVKTTDSCKVRGVALSGPDLGAAIFSTYKRQQISLKT